MLYISFSYYFINMIIYIQLPSVVQSFSDFLCIFLQDVVYLEKNTLDYILTKG